MISDWALVLEGGGMRGVFTSGVLDYLMDKNIYFPYTIGVSAGACNGLSYASKQRGRAKISNIDLLDKYHYISPKFFWSNKSILNMDFLFDEMPNKVLPYDFDTYFASPDRFIMVTSNCETGDGYNQMVLVLTRNKGYRKEEKEVKLPPFFYHKYPALKNRLCHRMREYNKTMDEIEMMEKNNQAIVIRPQKPLVVDRIEQNIKKLTDLYEEGYYCAEAVFSAVNL